MNKWTGIIQDWLYPPRCLVCGDPCKRSRDLCDGCHGALPWIDIACSHCGLPLETGESRLCGQCLKKPPAFRRAIAPCRYEEPVRHLLHQLKFRGDLAYARLLGNLLADRIVGLAERPDLIVPVPLHPRRYVERGFNQSLELARWVSRRTAIPLDFGLCTRTRQTVPQAELTAKDRRRNLRRAFAVSRPIKGGHIVILDDVMTTGTTANELAKTLLRAGAEHVDSWTVARA